MTSSLRDPDGSFTPVAECRVAPSDPDYVEGAIELTIDGIPILDRSMWDYVDQLWSYLVDLVPVLRAEGEAQTYFPDQPLRLSLRRVGAGVLVSANPSGGERKAVVAEEALVSAISAGAVEFFTALADLLPAERDDYLAERDKAAALV